MAAPNNSSALIHVETFEVGLGASMLLQFRTADGVVRVLADGGMGSPNPVNHVLQKLPGAIDSFGDTGRRIDLIIGTHYDGDHLRGLVPIIEDPAITIGEAWLPPVANDQQPHTDEPPDDGNFLALQFAGVNGADVLASYLRAKAEICTALATAERATDDFRSLGRTTHLSENHEIADFRGERHEAVLAYFGEHFRDALETIGVEHEGHADRAVRLPVEIEAIYSEDYNPYWRYQDEPRTMIETLSSSWRRQPERVEADALNLAMIRKSAAKDAITASHLKKVVEALKAKGVGIRCATVPDGQPRRFIWDSDSSRFVPSARLSSAIELTLLGPSIGLVKKHWDRLPIGQYLAFAARAAIPVEHTTPSNELSYVVRFACEGQNILVSGDTGFVDFRPPRTQDYFLPLLEKLAPLHVVQIAHHGGHNAYFYGAMVAAGFGDQPPEALLVLSHGVNDETRPSSAFGRFIELIRRDTDNFRLFFTSKPLDRWVRDFRSMIDPPTVANPSEQGDVRLVFRAGRWEVQQHLVQV